MATDRIVSLLQALDAELTGVDALDGDARRLAAQVATQLSRAAGLTPTPHGVEALAVRFEADHPALAAALRQVAGLLGNAGI